MQRKRRRAAHRRRRIAHRRLRSARAALSRSSNEMWERFASPPIRNAGTMGGNVANGSPIGDSMPGLIALGATVTLRNRERSRTLADGGSLPRLHEESDGRRRDPRSDRSAAARPRRCASGRTSCRSASIPTSPPSARRLRSSSTATGSAVAVSPSAEWRRRPSGRRPRKARCPGAIWNEATARAAMSALATDYTPLDRHAGERRLPPADGAESAVSVLSRDAAGQSAAGDAMSASLRSPRRRCGRPL